jgi:hypothetical protein
MSAATQAIYDRLAGDETLAGMLATYNDDPAIFTVDPAPGDASLPYIVTAGEFASAALDTKTTRGRQAWRDVRCYAEADGSAVTVEAIAERARELLHRDPLEVEGFGAFVAECSGPVAADEQGAYGRIVTVRMMMTEEG